MEAKGDYISLVIHSAERADKLKEILEFHGIGADLVPVSLPGLKDSELPVSVQVPVSSLRAAIKIIESGESYSSPLSVIKMAGMGRQLLIPVDFSPSSLLAVRVGFYIAKKFEIEPVILHSYIAPLFNPADPYADSVDEPADDITENEISDDLRNIASRQLAEFKKKIEKARADGLVPDLKFSTALVEGIPEQVIHEYCKQTTPAMVVMATRGVGKKESDLVGSVTAEVIDSCRVPLLAVPDNYIPNGVEAIKRIVMLCTFTGFDVVILRWLMRSFDYPSCEFYLLPASDRSISNVDAKLEDLKTLFSENYPTASFFTTHVEKKHFDDNMRTLLDENQIQLIIVPNKKSSPLSRFFKPTLAHRILFERDIPLLVLPY